MDKFMRRVYPEAITFNRTAGTDWKGYKYQYDPSDMKTDKELAIEESKYINQSSLAKFRPNANETYPLCNYSLYSPTTFSSFKIGSGGGGNLKFLSLDTNCDSVYKDNPRFAQKGALFIDASQTYYGILARSWDLPLNSYTNTYNFSYGFYMKITKEQYKEILSHDNFYVPCSIELEYDSAKLYNGIDHSSNKFTYSNPRSDLFINFCSSNKNCDSACVKICYNNKYIIKEVEYKLVPDKWIHFMITKDYSEEDSDVFRLYIDGHLYLHWNANLIRELLDKKLTNSNISFAPDGTEINSYDDYLKLYNTKVYDPTKKNSFYYYTFPATFGSGMFSPLTSSPWINDIYVSNIYYYNFGINGDEDAVKFVSDSKGSGYYPVSCYIDDIFLCNDIITTEENFELPNRPFIEVYPEGVMSPTVFDLLGKQKEWYGSVWTEEYDPVSYPLIPTENL